MASFYSSEVPGPKTSVHVDDSETYTTVTIEGLGVKGVGTAKRNPKDRPDVELGFKIALVRALEDFVGEQKRVLDIQ